MLDVSTFAYNSEAPFELTVLSEQVKDGERIQFVSVQDGEYYFELASEPKQIAWYENCNHELGAQARLDRAIFLCEQLGLARPSQEILKLLERVPSPIPLEEAAGA